MVNFDAPVTKPAGQSKAEVGPQSAEINKVELKKSKTGTEYLSVWLKLDKGGMAFESFFDSDKEFPIYKLRRFLEAIKVELSGSLTLKDIAKFIKVGTKLDIVVAVDDKGYASADFSHSNDGFYAFGEITGIDDEDMPFDVDDSETSEEASDAPVADEDY